MKRPKTTLLGNVLLLVIIVALFIILGEITIRVMGIDYFTDKTHQFDDKLGVIPIADISTTHQLLSGEAITRWTTNSKGFRTSEYQQENQNKVIVVFGDSFVEGYGVNNNEMFTHRLDQQLKDISVYPFGVSTFGTAQSYLMMENIIPEYKPEIVVLALFLGNDIWDNSLTLSDESKPYYVDKGFFYYGNVKPQETTIIKTLQFKIGKYSKFAGFVAHNLRKIMLTDTGNGNSFDKRYLIYNKTYDPEWQEAMNLTKTLLLKTK
ncbi:MAG: hypothetical protein QGH47_06075, partial [Candidatus Woesearchaeota archaeon]|nr:hypothetical protein [Candidatus Woesearchaeota archaeon]